MFAERNLEGWGSLSPGQSRLILKEVDLTSSTFLGCLTYLVHAQHPPGGLTAITVFGLGGKRNQCKHDACAAVNFIATMVLVSDPRIYASHHDPSNSDRQIYKLVQVKLPDSDSN